MNSLLLQTSWRYLLRHPWQIGLAILGVALGVAVVVSIDLANGSARRAFSLSTETVAGRATHQIVGGPTGLDEQLYARLRVELGVRPAAPVVEGFLAAPQLQNRPLRVLGVDPFAEAPFRSFLVRDGLQATDELGTLLVEPATALIAEQTAAQFGLRSGDQLVLRNGAEERRVRIIGLLSPEDATSGRALEGLLLVDIATAQELLGMLGRLSHIDLIIPDDGSATATLERISAALPPGVELTRPATRGAAIEQMTRAFELNLTALSLLALIVGMFLIYNTITFSVVQRRGLLGTLRCLGVTRGQIGWLVLLEAGAISILGALLGTGLGVLLGRGLVLLVTQTINDLYYVVEVRSLAIDPLILLKGLLLGIGATLAAAAVPALEATLSTPRGALRRSSLEDRMRRMLPLSSGLGLLLLTLGALLVWVPGRSLIASFSGLFALVIGCALLTPLATVGLMLPARPVFAALFGLLGRMAARDVVATLSRTAVAIAALMVAISVTIGVGTMVGSFRQTVINWLESTLIADIYVSPPSLSANRVEGTLDPQIVQRISGTPGVGGVSLYRSATVESAGGPLRLVALELAGAPARTAWQFVDGNSEQIWQQFEQGALIISEPLAYKANLTRGDKLTLNTERGPREFEIAGVFYDYTSDVGVAMLAMPRYHALWSDRGVSSLGLFLAPGAELEPVLASLQAQVPAEQELLIRSNRTLRSASLEIFDRTFAITTVLQLLATLVAFIGILSALMALQLERARDIGILRANGLTPGQVWGNVLSQTSLMGLTAGLLALPLGLLLALVLIFVINRRSFGWSLQLSIDPGLFVQAVVLSIVAALLAGLYPAWKMARSSPALALREE